MLVPAFTASPPLTGATQPAVTTLFSFNGDPNGSFPLSQLVLGKSGVLYGTTSIGGASGWGTVFQMLPPATKGAPWTQKTIYNFTGLDDGANPSGALVLASTSVLYGTTYQGGSTGYGTVFELIPGTGGTWTETTIYTFKGGTADGANPQAGLIQNPTSLVIFGSTVNAGSMGNGTLFSLTPAVGGVWTELVLYSFLGGTADGANPLSPLTLAGTDMFYGTTSVGGASGAGTVFSLVISGGIATETVIYSFTGLTDGATPEGGLVLGTGGVLYGSSYYGGNATGCALDGYLAGCGTIFELTPPASGGAWTLSVLHTFSGTGTDGAHPFGSLAVSGAQAVYGSTVAGGSTDDTCFPASFTGCGTVFRLRPPTSSGGAWTGGTLAAFTGDNGGGPNGVTLSKSGEIYGTTYNGGALGGGYGTVFELAP